MRTLEETIGVRVPGQGYQLATVRVRATDSDEDILRGLSRVVGTTFNVSGTQYELISLEPYKLKRLVTPKRKDGTVDDPVDEVIEVVTTSEVIKSPPGLLPLPNAGAKGITPCVGETWKTKDKRRSTTFTISAIDGDYAVTPDGRRIQLARFCRYERLDLTS